VSSAGRDAATFYHSNNTQTITPLQPPQGDNIYYYSLLLLITDAIPENLWNRRLH